MVIFTDFSIDYDAILDDDILSIPTYFIKKWYSIKYLDL